MERPGVSLWWFPLFLFAVLSSAAAQNEPVYTAVNGDINLKPASSGPFTNILWKHKGDLVVEWVNNELDYYGMFKDRATLDTATGGLVIKNTNENFTGLYTVELNSSVQPKGYEVVFIKEVNKPEVDVKPLACSHADNKDCKLVCLSYETPAFGPLTYSWREGDGEWIQGDKEMPIVNDEKTKGIKTFSCLVKNPISLAESVLRDNPFYQEQNGGSSSGGIAAGVIVTILLAIAAGGGGYVFYKKKHSFQPVSMQHVHDEEDPPANRNGDASNQPPTQVTPNESPANDDTDKKTPTENAANTAT